MSMAVGHYPDVAASHHANVSEESAQQGTLAQGQKLHMLKARAVEAVILLTLLISLAGVAALDLWGIMKVWHAVFR